MLNFMFYTVVTLTYLVMYLTNWRLFNFFGIRGQVYMDLLTIGSYTDCLRNFNDLPNLFNSGTCWKGYNYGPTAVLLLKGLSLIGVNLYYFGHLLVLSTLFILVMISRKFGSDDFIGRAFQIMLIVSPGILLLMERANFDLIIFLLLVIILAMEEKKMMWPRIFAMIFITLMKFYTFPAFIFLVWQSRLSSTKKAIVVAAVAAVVFIFAFPVSGQVPYFWFLSYGSSIFFIYLDYFLNEFGDSLRISLEGRILLGGIMFAIVANFLYRFSTPFREIVKSFNLQRKYIKDSKIGKMSSTLSLIFLSTFFLATNFDYRFIFAVVPLILCDKALFTEQQSNLRRIFFFVTFLAFFVGSAYGGPRYILQGIQILGDSALLIIIAAILMSTFSSLTEQKAYRYLLRK